MTNVTVAIVHFNEGRVLETVLADGAAIPVMATALQPFLTWERNFLNAVKPRLLPQPGEEDQAGDYADTESLYALVEGRDFPVGNIPARGWQWNSTRNPNEPVFTEFVPPPAPVSFSQALEDLESEFLVRLAQLKTLNGQ